MKRNEHTIRNRTTGFAAFGLKNGFQRLFNWNQSMVLLIVFSFLTASCKETPCTSSPETFIGIEFCEASVSGIVSKKYPINQVQIRNSRVFQDTLSKSTASFKIRFPSNSEAFWLSFLDSTSKDSVRFSFSRVMNFAGESCGYYYGFNGLKVDSIAGANFERAQIITNQGDSSNKVHVRIFW